MSKVTNLTSQVNRNLPSEILALMRKAGEIADSSRTPLYLVGGPVRDLLLGKLSLDIDLVVEGDAPALARQLAEDVGGEVKIHHRFSTATLHRGDVSIDVITARSEVYSRPGALPIIRPGSIEDDLRRRDFTINAMAIRLNHPHYGELLDLHSGESDLKQSLIRVLHPGSFIDDATRILRALRYEQRLGFHLERGTETLLHRNVSMLNTISGDRLRHELELILREERPEDVLHRADELGVLSNVFPSLRGNGWLAERFERARRTVGHRSVLPIYLALMVYSFTEEECERLIKFLRIPGATAQVMRDTIRLKFNLEPLEQPALSPSAIYGMLRGYSPTAVLAVDVASDNPIIHQHLEVYLTRLRYVRTSLDGKALLEMGVPPGPRVGEVLNILKKARLDGGVSSRQGEIDLVNQWLK